MKSRRFALLAALLATFCLVNADLPATDARSQGEAALKDRDWAKAEQLLGQALAAAKEGQDEILYMIATAQQNAKNHDAAIATLDRLVKEHPASGLRMKAIFKKGDVLSAKKEFALAAQIYDAQVAALTGAERRKKIAMVYVDAGREFLNPKDPKDPTFVANFQAARNLLVKALELEALAADEEGVRADVIACELKGGMDRGQLLKTCREFLEKYPKSAKLDEVLFAQGTGFRDTGRAFDAKKAWLRVAAEAAASKRAPEALYSAALLHVNEQGGTSDLEELRRGLPLLRRVAKEFAASEWGPKAGYLAGIALSQYEELRDDARAELTAFVNANAKDERAPEALLRVAWLHRADFDDAKAIATLEDFLKRFPDSPRWPEVRQQIADVRFEGAQRAFARKDWAAARAAAQEFTALHPTDGRAASMSYRVGATLKEEKKFKEAVEAWMKTAAKYPAHDEGHQARFSAAELMAAELDDFETAMKELPKVGGSWNPQAQQLLRKLQDKALAMQAERVFNGVETPVVKLTVRNVETVKMRYWSLDLKDYFEKKASTGGLESLEVSIIAPDKEWEVPVKDFRRFKEMKLDVELPKKEPGAYVVWASAGVLEAKTVVVVSDLAMIARAGRAGATVIVQNQRTGERVENVTIRTAADGKHLKGWTPETRAAALSFLVESGGHLAFRDLNVGGLAVAPERQPGALLLTDRSIVAPGDELRVRLIFRDAGDGAYFVPKDKTYRLSAATAHGIEFFEADVTPSKFGTAGAAFTVLKGLSGQIRIQVFEKSKPQEKLVGQAQVMIGGPEGRQSWVESLLDDGPRFVGDDVDVTAVLRDAWDRPMPGRAIRILTAADEDWKDAMTGADGTFTVALRETDRYYRGAATFAVMHEGRTHQVHVPLLPRGVGIVFEAESRVTEPLVAGDAKAIVFTAKRADESAFAGTFKWAVVRTAEDGSRVAVAAGDVATDRDGKGRFTFTAKDGGIHTVSVTMRDADGIPTRAQTAVQAVDDKEERKLRLLSTADEFEAGKPIELSVLSRLDKGLAFVTLEGERIEQVLAVTLDKGRTAVKLNAPPATTRDFTVTVMIMQGNKFHADVRDFRTKWPEVKVEPGKKEYRPGEEAVVKVTARPGSEVLLRASEWLSVGIDAGAFHPSRVGPYFAGDSSAATAFAWATQQIDPALLEALARLEQLDHNESQSVMMERDLESFEKARGDSRAEDKVGTGGGGGGQYGGRFGGRRNLVARGGGSSRGAWIAERVPEIFAVAEADASGVATFRFKLPHDRTDLTVQAWAWDATNAIATNSAKIKTRGPVTAVVRLPESAVEGEKTSATVLLTNWTGQEVTAAVGFDAVEAQVKIPARSTLEKTFEWTAAPAAAFRLDGVKRDFACAMRSKGPSTANELGGAYAARVEVKLEGEGRTRVRVATGPAALLESLAEGEDPLTPASDQAARLIARIARHRYEKTDATKRAVAEFAALWRFGAQDAAALDVSWPVLVYLAAAEAKAAEFDIEPDPAMLKARFAQATTDDVKALILFALARGGKAEYGYVHRLWRGADGLSARALACVALALKAAGKTDEAKAALDRLAKAAKDDHWESAAAGSPDTAATHYATTALAAFAIAEIDATNALLTKSRAWLLARRPRTAFERAALALAMQSVTEKSQVTEVKVDGQSVKGFGEVAATQGVIEPVGTGTFFVLAWRETGVAPEAAVKVAVKRTAGWPTLLVEGRAVAASAVAVKEPVENPSMAKVAAGNASAITYELTIPGPTIGYTLVELPQATGLRSEASALRILLPPQSEAERKQTVVVAAYADAPGAYPDVEVLAPGAAFRDGWQMTHGERFGAGAVYADKKMWKQARETLLPLFDKGTLLDAPMIVAARHLAYSAIELQEHETVVRYFEVLKEKAPGEVVPFDKIRAVGRAYAAMNEHERAMQVHSGTCDAYFLQEAGLAGALEDLGRLKDAVSWMKTFLSEYPDSALNREMVFGFGQRLYSRAKKHRDPAEKDPKMLTRAEILAESAATLERYLAWFPADTEGDRVMLSLCSAYLEAGSHEAAEVSARAAAARFPKSRFLDTFDYTQAFAFFAQKKFAEALVMCDRLETHDYGIKANPGPEVIRTQAVLMKAQIFHAKGELDKALENYKKVKDKSPDAVRSISFLEREALVVQEVTIAPLSKAAELELEYAGVAEAHVRAYKVDLTMLALRRKNIADPSTIEVAGIRPVFEKTYTLDHPNARRREKQKFTLELKEAGAYLVGVKAGDFFASGLILRSNLSMSVQEEATGTVRVNVADVAGGGFAEGVKVTIFGTQDQKIASDKTDLRGIWETHGVRGLAVVVAEKDGHVAMFRGQAAIGLQPPPKPSSQELKNLTEQQKEVLDDELNKANDAMEENYGKNVRKQQQGVEVERTKK
ncbi:MAG: tetratricopeptide repeat protein [Planctomycetes bacterium]|nr:tetratricopeptide repeat protein [Planctomycetota bacterium]